MAHIHRQANHGEVVNNEDHFELKGFPVLHQTRAGPDYKQIKQEDERHREWGVDQQPGVRSLVWIAGIAG